ncbi:MAG: tail fiber domain-containing protein, partial [Betaproteobacteria bacterium]|nr:tail fiber domain-containing protein [Betaproteobacteria bacterium]
VPVLIDSAGQLGTASSSQRVKDDIANMGVASDVLSRLRPVTFTYKAHANLAQKPLQYGLIAEEVAAVAPELVARNAAGEIETVYYQHLAPMLLNELQKQQRTIQNQAAQLELVMRELAAIKLQLPAK